MDLWVEGCQPMSKEKRLHSGQYDVFTESDDEDEDEGAVSMDFIRRA